MKEDKEYLKVRRKAVWKTLGLFLCIHVSWWMGFSWIEDGWWLSLIFSFMILPVTIVTLCDADDCYGYANKEKFYKELSEKKKEISNSKHTYIP